MCNNAVLTHLRARGSIIEYDHPRARESIIEYDEPRARGFIFERDISSGERLQWL
jgi:hypothetical protein